MICYSFSKPLYFLFSSDVPALLYYSHIPTAIIALIIGFFVFWKGRQFLINKLLFAISACFSLWVISNLILWTNVHGDFMLFIWSFLRVLSSLISVLSIYFIYVFLEKKDVSALLKSIFLIITVPIIVLSPTYINLKGFNITNCDAFMFEGPLFQFSRVFFGVLAMVWILVLLIRKYRKSEVDFKKQIWLMGLGMEFFLFSFFIVTFLAAYLTDKGILSDSRLEFYGLFGMDIFIGFLAYLIVRYKAFHIKLFAAQALVVGTIILIASQFAFIQNTTNIILTAITLAIVSTFGWWLVKSVGIEIKQKEELEIANAKISDQNDQLEVANVELKKADQAKNEFINIASHQLRTPITVIKGTISMLQDGTMDSFNGEQKKKFYDGARAKCQKLEDIINDILNATSLTNKKFNVMDKEMEKIDVKEFFEKMIDGFKAETVEREIDLSIGKLDSSVLEVFGQRKYLEEAFSNLLSNAIKYTPSPKQTPDVRDKRDGKATIIISNRRNGDDVIFSVKDNGIGIPTEEIPNLFKKFARAQNAVNMYTDGTGLGLFIIKEIVEGHGGKVWVESKLNKGSEFFVKLPIKPKNKVDIKEYIKERADIKM